MKSFRAILLLPVLLVACGGTGAPATGATGAAPTSPAGTGSTGATVAPPVTTAPGGGGTAGNWCLNTPPEVEAALHVQGVVGTSTDAPGVGGGCIYSLADNTPVHAISVVNSANFQATFDAAKTQQGAVEISGIGNGAILVSAQGPLIVLTDKGLISMGPLGPQDVMTDAAKYRAAAEELGKTAAGRVP